MGSCSQESLLGSFRAVHFIFSQYCRPVQYPQAWLTAADLSFSLVTFCFCSVAAVWQTIPGVKSLRGNIAGCLFMFSVYYVCVCCCRCEGSHGSRRLWGHIAGGLAGGKEALSLFSGDVASPSSVLSYMTASLSPAARLGVSTATMKWF